MNVRENTLFICLIMAIGVGCRPAPVDMTEEQASEIRQAVEETLETYREHYASKDWDALIGLYQDDPRFAWIEDGTVTYRSVAEVRTALETLPSSMTIETTYRDTEIAALSPTVASVITGFETTFADSSGVAFSFDGVITMTLISSDAGWRILGGHTSSPKPREW